MSNGDLLNKLAFYFSIHLFLIPEKRHHRMYPRLNKSYLSYAASFHCNLNSVEWYYRKKPIPFSNVDMDRPGTITIIRPELSNGGWYYCYGIDRDTGDYVIASGIYIPIGNSKRVV